MSDSAFRTAIVGFASFFDGVTIDRAAPDGTIQTIAVPLQYSGKQSFVQRLFAQEDIESQTVYQSLPRMAFNIESIDVNNTRKMQRLGKISNGALASYNPIPYDMKVNLTIVAKNVSDCLQIMEVILPKFAPERVITISPNGFQQEVIINLESTSFQNDFEGTLDKRQLITANLAFTVIVSLTGTTHVPVYIEQVFAKINDTSSVDYASFGYPVPVATYTASGTSPSGTIFESWVE